MTAIGLEHVSKRFGSVVAVDDVGLRIERGQLFFLLGPSGCGKSTLLRIIAGLEVPDAGKVLFDDRDVTQLGTEKRNAVMCFQSYALWPHMSVRENVRFGLDVRKLDRAEQDRRVAEVLDLMQMRELSERKPNELSGGQQQRVALARALAVKPACLLLDEPLSNLDAKLRSEMRTEIRRLCKTGGFTTIYVTHDQKEALSIADRIAVMKDGRLAQVGGPSELYHHPTSAFVAQFIGSTNLLQGRVVEHDQHNARVETPAGNVKARMTSPLAASQSVTLSIRPEQMQIARNGAMTEKNRLVGKPIETTFLGEATEHILDVNGQRLKVVCAPPMFEVPDVLTVEFDPTDVVILTQ